MSSPWLDLGRKMTGGKSSAERAELGVELQWWMASAGSIRPWSRARSRSGRCGVDSGQSCAALGARNQSGVVRVGRRDDERRPARRARVRSVRSRREEGERGTGSFEGARDDKSGARTTRIVGMDDAWSRSPAFSRRYGRGRAQCRAVVLFTRLKDFSSSLTN